MLVTYESDITEAQRLMERAARRTDDVINGGPDIRIGSARYPASPTCYIDEYADDGVLLELRYWADKPYKLLSIRSEVQEHIWSALQSAAVNVEIAYPHQHLVFDETSGQAKIAMADASAGDRDAEPAPGTGGIATRNVDPSAVDDEPDDGETAPVSDDPDEGPDVDNVNTQDDEN